MTTLITQTENTPQEAGEILDKSNDLEILPSDYQESKTEYDSLLDNQKAPKILHPTVEQFADKSVQHASVVKKDLGILNYVGRQIDLISDHVFERPSTQRRKAELAIEKMDNPELWTEEKELELLEVMSEEQDQNEQNYGLSQGEQLPAQVLGALSDMVQGVAATSDIIAAGTTAGAGIGAGIGLLTPLLGGAAAGATIGATKGLYGSFLVGQSIDAYRTMKGNTFADLSFINDDNGNPVNLDDERKAAIAEGVGLIAGLSDAVVGHITIGKNPFIKNMLSKAGIRKLILKPSTQAQLAVLGGIGKSIASGSSMGVMLEVARLSAEELSKTFDGEELNLTGEEGFLGRLVELVSDENKRNQALERVEQAATLGGLTAGTISAGTSAIGAAINSKLPTHQEINQSEANPIKQAVNIVDAQETVKHLSEVLDSTEMKKASPRETKNFIQSVSERTGLDKVWFMKGDSQKVNDLFDKSGLLKDAVNGIPQEVPIHEFLPLIKEFPELADHMMIDPDGPTPNQGRDYINRINETKQKAEELFQRLDVGEELSASEQNFLDGLTKKQEAVLTRDEIKKHKSLVEKINKGVELAPEEMEFMNFVEDRREQRRVSEGIRDITTPEEFINQGNFTDAILQVTSEADAAKFEAADLASKVDTIDLIEGRRQKKISRLAKESYEGSLVSEIEANFKKLEDNKTFDILENFTRAKKLTNELGGKVASEVYRQMTSNHKEEGFPPYAIDPRSLSDAQKRKYKNAHRIRGRKVFVEGGLHVEEAASYVNAPNGSVLLDILMNTPDRDKMAKKISQSRKEVLKAEALADAESQISKVDAAYNERRKNHLRQLKFIKENDWTAYREGIKKVVQKLPLVDEVRKSSESLISKTKLGDLNSRKFLVGEKVAERKAVNHILKYEVEQAFKRKDDALNASELARAAQIAEMKVEKAFSKLKKFNDPKVIRELKDAGSFDAAAELLDTFNLSKQYKNISERNSFDNWVKDQVQKGRGEIIIPDRLNDPKLQATDMTVESFLKVSEVLDRLRFEARRKNKLHAKFEKQKMIQTEEMIAETIRSELEQHPDFDSEKSKRTNKPVGSRSLEENVRGALSTVSSLFTNIENIVTRLDQDKLGGTLHKMLIRPLKGDSRTGERSGWLGKQADMKDLVTQMNKAADEFLGDKFKDISNDVRTIPEFENSPALNNGVLRKSDLMMLMAYHGDDDGYRKMQNYGISNEMMSKVLDRELDSNDMAFIQNFMLNTFKSYEDRTAVLHKETTGEDVNFISPRKIIHRGKVYEGGYFPHRHQRESIASKAGKHLKKRTEEMTASVFGGEETGFYAKMRASEATEQGRTIDRVGSSQPLDFQFSGLIDRFEEVLHDLNYRKPVQDTLQILKNPVISESITNTVGPEMNSTLLNGVIEVAGKLESTNHNYFGEQQKLANKIFKTLDSSFAVSMLGANIQSIGLQPVSFAAAATRMGNGGTKHLLNVAQKMVRNPDLMMEMRNLAEDINPSIKFASDAIDSSLQQSAKDHLPNSNAYSKNYKKLAKNIDPAVRLLKSVQGKTMGGFTTVDGWVKTMVALGSYEQFMSGDVENFPMSRLKKMTAKEIQEEAYAYGRQVSRLSLTHSAIEDRAFVQKSPVTALFSKFWTDPRQQLNTLAAVARKTRYGLKKSKKSFSEGDFRQGMKEASQTTSSLLGAMTLTAVGKSYLDFVRSNGEDETPIEEYRRGALTEGELAWEIFRYWGLAAPTTYGDTLPVVSAIKYAVDLDSPRDYRNVQVPLLKVMNDMATTAVTIRQLVSDEADIADLSDTQVKAALQTAAIPIGGLPINAFFKAKKWNEETGKLDFINEFYEEVTDGLSDKIDEYINRNEKTLPKEMVEDLKVMSDRYRKNDDQGVPDSTAVVISLGESNNQWNKQNPETGAAGIFQFTKKQWNDLSDKRPDLGLTENGRVAKDTEQQEIAMDALLEENSKILIENSIPVNDETLYGSHLFGIENYVKIKKSSKKTSKLIKILGADEVKLLDSRFKKFTAGKVNDYLKEKVEQVYQEISQ